MKKAWKYIRNLLIITIVLVGLAYIFIINIKIVDPITKSLSLDELSVFINTPSIRKGQLLHARQEIMRESMGKDTSIGDYIISFKQPTTFNFKTMYSSFSLYFPSKSQLRTIYFDSENDLHLEIIENRQKTLEQLLSIKIPEANTLHRFTAKNPNSVLDIHLDYYVTENESYLYIAHLTSNSDK